MTPSVNRLTGPAAYAELYCTSNFSFLRGASHPEELVVQADQLGYAALAITDECSVAGVVRAHSEAKRLASPLPILIGSTFRLDAHDDCVDPPAATHLHPDQQASHG
ncbi:MAG: PHP domain-containing protein, partial [Burkholderiaceae bacterium]